MSKTACISMSIDPGITGSGFAIWQGKRFQHAGIVFPGKIKKWQPAGYQVAAQLHEIAKINKIEKVFCEFPAFFQGGKGQVTAKSGSLVKLAWFCGFLETLFVTEFTPFEQVRVIDWKGQLPKDVVERRICKILKRGITKNLKSHMWDAVGIGLYKHGRFGK